MIKHLGLFVFTCAAVNLCGQDIHWSQPSSILIYHNPAFTGITNKYSVGVNFRDQWSSINKSYRTYALSGDYRFDRDVKKATMSVGGLLYRDASADGSYIINSGGITLSCQLTIDEVSRFAGGLNYNFVQNTINTNQYTWSNQFDGQAYNPGLSTGEEAGNLQHTFSDLGAGLSYIYHEKTGRLSDNNPNYLLLGYSANHLNRPIISTTGGSDKLSIKHTMMLTSLVEVSNTMALKPTVLFQAQGKMMELTGGTLFMFGMGQVSRYTGIRKSSYFSAGLLYRVKDALIPTLEFEKPSYVCGLSYDINLSQLSSSSKYRGGVELYIRLKAPGKTPQQDKKEEDTRPMY